MPVPPSLRHETMASPLGPLLVVTGQDGALYAVEWASEDAGIERRHGLGGGWAAGEAASAASLALARYFAGDLGAIEALPVAAAGTPFQQQVWAALRAIPAGATTSYGALARTLGRPGAMRAVGLANGANPVGVVVPCHRVIGADGSLTGYGGGLDRKRWLLEHEARHAARVVQPGPLFARAEPPLQGSPPSTE